MKRILITLIATSSFFGACQQKNTNKLETSKQEHIMNTKIAQQNKELVRRFFQYLEAEDITNFIDLFAEEGQQNQSLCLWFIPE